MDLNIFIVLLCTLFAGGRALKCNECVGAPGSCVSKETTCPSVANTCASATVVTTIGDTSVNLQAKSCEVIQSCGNGSLNFGVLRSKVSMQCCNTDLCNSINVPDYISNSANGKQCYFCDGKSCLNTLNCLGNEDYCITATTNIASLPTTVKGCTTKSLCDDVSQAPPGFMGLSCCQGDLCNGAKTVTQTYGRALKCNECIGVSGSCVSKETTCSSEANTCASVTVVTTIGEYSMMESKCTVG
ncbi:phospholipase A2 inhibitor and Ly6/PLAUR domain-containing protein-like isoform X1 [Misgurnus anguillicaudatus]|uniref:phospholipase A2 inhibitor and Ly6/PLAUR domain-containing protein-like isoform X1 n=1 Tax=Misgurnus anguillicaudatus TaxID=75329 RepID=UPI003CCF287D